MNKNNTKIFFFVFVIFSIGYLHMSSPVYNLKNDKLYSYMDKIESDTLAEKMNNPESCYQTSGGNVYLLKYGNLYKTSLEKYRMNKILSNVRGFIVTGKVIYYCTESEYSLHCCDKDGCNDIILLKNVDAFTLRNDNSLMLLGHIEQWTLGKYNLINGQFSEINIEGSVGTKKVCFYNNKVICADTYDISIVDSDSGKVAELWSLYDDYEALAEVTCIYIHKDKIYFGISAVNNKASSKSGLWRMDINGKNQEQLTYERVDDICFVEDEYVIIN